MRLTPPDGYSKDEVTAIADTSEKETKTEDLRKDNADSVTPVNIIAIMNESWFDYRSVGDPQTSESYMPFLDSLTENNHQRAHADVYQGRRNSKNGV